MSTHQTPSIFSRGARVKFDAENYGISSIEECNRIIKEWNQLGKILVYHNTVIHEDAFPMAPKDLASHHRTCHLRHGGEECTC